MAHSIEYKNFDVLRGLFKHPLHPKLLDIIQWLLVRYTRFYLTETYRKQLHPNDLHGTNPLRAIDLRSWIFDDPEAIADDINHHWTYDSVRLWKKVCVYHEARNGSGMHFHVQVHDNTKRVGA